MTQEAERKMHECVACGHLYEDPAPSSCDCCENKANAYIPWVARRAALEAKQAAHIAPAGKMVEVQMPEPTAYLYHDAPTLADYIANERAGIPLNSACISVNRMKHCRNETPLFTEQQVRQLLAEKESK